MVFIFTALYPEAKPLIKRFGLKKRVDSTRFQQFVSETLMKMHCETEKGDCSSREALRQYDLKEKKTQGDRDTIGKADSDYENPEQGIVLTITGVGPISAAAAVSAALTEYDIKPTDQILSFGTAALLHGKTVMDEQLRDTSQGTSLFLINKILDQNIDRTFYPDMLINCSIPEASVVTGSMVLSERAAAFMDVAAADYDLYDMEAAAVYQAAAFFAGPHQMSFLRVVTDSGIHEDDYDVRKMSQLVTERVTLCVEAIVDYVEKLLAVSVEDEKGSSILRDSDVSLVEKVITDGHFSKVMQDQFRQYVKYAELSGINWQSAVEGLYREAELPTVDKRGGKKVLDAIKNSITE